jgi:hypothetical protein
MAFSVKQKNGAQFRLQTDKFCTFRVMDHNSVLYDVFHDNEEN